MFNWNSLASPPFLSGSGVVALTASVLLPGASKRSPIQLRPFTGSSWIWRGSTLPPRLEVATLSNGDSAVTVTVSTRSRF